MRPFAYARAGSADDAVAAVSQNGAAAFLAGGTNIVDLIKIDVAHPATLVDIGSLPLAAIDALPDGSVRIGALAKMSDTADNAAVRAGAPAVSMALNLSASAQLRNMATIGGNVLQRTRCVYFRDVTQACNKRRPGSGCAAIGGDDRKMAILGTSERCIAVNPSDFSVAMLVTDATIHLHGPSGERTTPFLGFHRLADDPSRDTNIGPGELITAISFSPTALTRNSTYLKVRDRASYEFALVSVAAALEVRNGQILDARVALGGVAHAPWRARDAEAALVGRQAALTTYAAAAEVELRGAKARRLNGFKIGLARNAMMRALAAVGGAA
ncbi:MAG TPA: xanthine dehydrogenase family protein subunit M [Candidatus Elarobacter sp.]|nr:xanthine dehydrogenase family protein subunit M [Candidatus Elarobacter sp.]